MAAEVKYLGVEPDVTTCMCCGKSNLKKTIALDINGTVKYYGTTCASKALKKVGVSVKSSLISEYSEVISKINHMLAEGYSLQTTSDYIARRGYQVCVTDYVMQKNSIGGYYRKYTDAHIALKLDSIHRIYEPVVVSWWRC